MKRMRRYQKKPLQLYYQGECIWLLGNVQVSRSFEYKMKSSIRRKVQTLFELDIPLLLKNNFISFGKSEEEALAWDESMRPNKSSCTSLGKVEVARSKPAHGSCSTDLDLLVPKLTLYHNPVLLSQQELDFLAEKGKYSKKIERNLRYKIRKKVEAFKAVELPLLIETRLLNVDSTDMDQDEDQVLVGGELGLSGPESVN